jgi:hypothetical protein
MVTLKTYNYTGESNRIGKTLQENETYTGLLNVSFDILKPVLRFRTKTPVTFNYVFIAELNRYYFVDSITIDGDLCTVRLSIDVLQTYGTQILASKAILTVGTNIGKYDNNRQNRYDLRPVLTKVEFNKDVSFEDTGKIVMVTIKGNK